MSVIQAVHRSVSKGRSLEKASERQEIDKTSIAKKYKVFLNPHTRPSKLRLSRP
jgi:hypothetical protein